MRRILSLGLLLGSMSVWGQQLPQYSQFSRNPVVVNPGAVGAYDQIDITLGGRYQWVGFGNLDYQGNVSPRTAYLYGTGILSRTKVRYNPALRISNGPIRSPKVGTGKLKHALGGQLVMDEYGAFNTLQAAAMYAIHIPINRDVNMSLGLKAGMTNHSFLSDKAQVLSDMTGTVGLDPVYQTFMASGGASSWIMDVGAGFYMYSQKFYFGVSADQLTKDLVSTGTGAANFNPEMHFQLVGGYKFDLNQDWSITPSLLGKFMSPAPLTIEGNLMFDYKQWLWFGASYRHKDAIVAMIGGNISQRFHIGYSYDYSISNIRLFNSGGHEVVLGFRL